MATRRRNLDNLAPAKQDLHDAQRMLMAVRKAMRDFQKDARLSFAESDALGRTIRSIIAAESHLAEGQAQLAEVEE